MPGIPGMHRQVTGQFAGQLGARQQASQAQPPNAARHAGVLGIVRDTVLPELRHLATDASLIAAQALGDALCTTYQRQAASSRHGSGSGRARLMQTLLLTCAMLVTTGAQAAAAVRSGRQRGDSPLTEGPLVARPVDRPVADPASAATAVAPLDHAATPCAERRTQQSIATATPSLRQPRTDGATDTRPRAMQARMRDAYLQPEAREELGKVLFNMRWMDNSPAVAAMNGTASSALEVVLDEYHSRDLTETELNMVLSGNQAGLQGHVAKMVNEAAVLFHLKRQTASDRPVVFDKDMRTLRSEFAGALASEYSPSANLPVALVARAQPVNHERGLMLHPDAPRHGETFALAPYQPTGAPDDGAHAAGLVEVPRRAV